MKQKILFIVCLLAGLLFINAGLDKFLHYMPMPADMPPNLVVAFNSFMQIGWLLPLVGAAEIIGGSLLIIPKTRAFGAIVLFPVLVGILLTNTVTEPSGAPIALVLFGIILWVIYENRRKYMMMFQ